MNNNWIKGSGTIIYDPHRGNMKNKTKWWAVVNVDREITRYFRWWVKRELWIDLYKPAWDAHISIIRGERPSRELMHLWKKYDGQRVDFLYNLNVRYSGDTTNDRSNKFWFVDVHSPFLMNIRTELNRPTNWNLHLTIGKMRGD